MTPDEFKKLRKAARLTQAQMGARLGYSRQAVIHWEANHYAIPDDVLDKLVERSLAPAPEPAKPITPISHPQFYNKLRGTDGWQRNHKHPHWWVHALGNRMSKAQKNYTDTIVTTTKDAETMVWTPERAITFTIAFLGVSREEAERLVRYAGFDVPLSTADAYTLAHNEYLAKFGSLMGFYDAHPEFERPKSTGQINPALKHALDSAFTLTPTQED